MIRAFEQQHPVMRWGAIAERIENKVRHLINDEGPTEEEALRRLKNRLNNRS